jgi:hypothetical protein
VLGQHRSTQWLVPTGPDDEERLTADIVELARRHGRLGYRKIAEMLRSTAGWIVNDKRVERIWRREESRRAAVNKPYAGAKRQGLRRAVRVHLHCESCAGFECGREVCDRRRARCLDGKANAFLIEGGLGLTHIDAGLRHREAPSSRRSAVSTFRNKCGETSSA